MIADKIDKYKSQIINILDKIWIMAEPGYMEYKTSKFLSKEFEKLGYILTYPEGIPGFLCTYDTKKDGPEILLFCELDAIPCPEHPMANGQYGAAHACGHHAQCAALFGVAAALMESSASNELCGKVKFCAVPAEELCMIKEREALISEGKIKHLTGKCEFMSRGYFDTSDIALMIHTTTTDGAVINKGTVGNIYKKYFIKGKAAHSGGCPWEARNALSALICALSSVNALRERFRDTDMIRFSPIILECGEAPGVVPDKAVCESYLRGVNLEAIYNADNIIENAFKGSCISIGTDFISKTLHGYAPLINNEELMNLASIAAEQIGEKKIYKDNSITPGSTDMGDISMIMPVFHGYMGGAEGTVHGKDYKIKNPEKACIESAKWQLTIIELLLSDKAKKATEIIKNSQPDFKSAKEYLDSLQKKQKSS